MSFYQPSTYEPGRSIGYLVRLINQATGTRLERVMAAEGLSNTQWQVLVSIYFSRGMTCAALARDLAHDKGAMTRLVDGLEERGLLKRERNAEDRRIVDLALTASGRDAAERGKMRTMGCWNGWLSDWDPAAVEGLIAALQRLHGTIEASPEVCA